MTELPLKHTLNEINARRFIDKRHFLVLTVMYENNLFGLFLPRLYQIYNLNNCDSVTSESKIMNNFMRIFTQGCES